MGSIQKWESTMRDTIAAHGPLPQGVDVVRNGSDPMYRVTIPGSSSPKNLANHPLSPKGRAELGALLKQLPVERGYPKDVVGVAHPPISYKPSEWTWESPVKGKEINSLLQQAFRISGLDLTNQQIHNGVQAVIKAKTQEQLYHPRDRMTIYITYMDHMFARVARHFKRSVVVFGPEIVPDAKNWKRTYSPASGNRPLVRARWGEGLQEQFRPIVLGYVPSLEFSKKFLTTSCFWFVMKPTPEVEADFQKRWKIHDWQAEASRFRSTNPKLFAWAAVAAQRSYLLRIPDLQNANLGEWIYHYFQFMNSDYGSRPFEYAKSNKWLGPTVTFNELTIWILASAEDSPARAYAKAWDEAILAYIQYMNSAQVSDWNKFIQTVKVMNPNRN